MQDRSIWIWWGYHRITVTDFIKARYRRVSRAGNNHDGKDCFINERDGRVTRARNNSDGTGGHQRERRECNARS